MKWSLEIIRAVSVLVVGILLVDQSLPVQGAPLTKSRLGSWIDTQRSASSDSSTPPPFSRERSDSEELSDLLQGGPPTVKPPPPENSVPINQKQDLLSGEPGDLVSIGPQELSAVEMIQAFWKQSRNQWESYWRRAREDGSLLLSRTDGLPARSSVHLFAAVGNDNSLWNAFLFSADYAWSTLSHSRTEIQRSVYAASHDARPQDLPLFPLIDLLKSTLQEHVFRSEVPVSAVEMSPAQAFHPRVFPSIHLSRMWKTWAYTETLEGEARSLLRHLPWWLLCATGLVSAVAVYFAPLHRTRLWTTAPHPGPLFLCSFTAALLGWMDVGLLSRSTSGSPFKIGPIGRRLVAPPVLRTVSDPPRSATFRSFRPFPQLWMSWFGAPVLANLIDKLQFSFLRSVISSSENRVPSAFPKPGPMLLPFLTMTAAVLMIRAESSIDQLVKSFSGMAYRWHQGQGASPRLVAQNGSNLALADSTPSPSTLAALTHVSTPLRAELRPRASARQTVRNNLFTNSQARRWQALAHRVESLYRVSLTERYRTLDNAEMKRAYQRRFSSDVTEWRDLQGHRDDATESFLNPLFLEHVEQLLQALHPWIYEGGESIRLPKTQPHLLKRHFKLASNGTIVKYDPSSH